MSTGTDETTAETATPTSDARGDGQGQSLRRAIKPSQMFAWDGPRLAITATTVLDSYRRPALSASTSKAMDGCPARWAAEKSLPSIEDPFGAAELGTSAHSVLEELMDLDIVDADERTPEMAMKILLAHSRQMWQGKDEDTLAKRGLWISAVHDAYRGIFEIEDPRTVSVHSTELGVGTPGGVAVEVGGVPFIGYIDRIDHTPKGLRPVDYKSGQKMPANITRFGDDHGDQMRLYAEVIRVTEGKMPKEALLYYTRLGKSRSVPLSPAKMREVLTKFKKSWIALNSYIDSGSFPTKESALCGWCPLVNACPTAQASGKVDRVGTAPKKVDLGIPVLRTMDVTEHRAVEARRKTPPAPEGDFGAAAGEAVAAQRDVDDFLSHDPGFDGLPDVEPYVPDEAFSSSAPADLMHPAAPGTQATTAEPAAPAAEQVEVEPDAIDEPAPERVVEAVEAQAAPTRDQTGDQPGEPDETPGTGSDEPAAAHLHHETTSAQEGANMSDTLLVEGKPWEETCNGNLNPAAYAATAVFGTVSLAYEELHKAGVKISKANIDGLSETFALIVAQAQDDLTGVRSFQDAANTRLRGALRTFIDANPLPWGGSEDAWDEWASTAVKHVKSMASAAIRLYEADLDGTPWRVLAIREADADSA